MQEEVYGTRDLSYSAWHRRQSTMRFVGIEKAQLLAMIDIDSSVYVEFDDGSKEPLALIEAAQDVGQRHKTATVTKKLAQRAGIPAYVLLYTLGEAKNPADPKYRDIEAFRYKRLYPRPHLEWVRVTPSEWATNLETLRRHSAEQVDKRLGNNGFMKLPASQSGLF